MTTNYKKRVIKLCNQASNSLMIMILVLFQTACVSIDERVEMEPVGELTTQSFEALFSIYPSYYSSMVEGKNNPSKLAQFYKFFDRIEQNATIESIQVSFRITESVKIKFIDDKKAVGGGTYTVADGLEFDDKGRILLPSKAIVSFFLGGGLRKVTLYLNTAGDLVVTQVVGSGGALLMVLPWVVYEKHMWIFPRIG
jgi:hypothetical protein